VEALKELQILEFLLTSPSCIIDDAAPAFVHVALPSVVVPSTHWFHAGGLLPEVPAMVNDVHIYRWILPGNIRLTAKRDS